MRILLVKNSIIPPITYGGTQRIVDWLAHDLISLGHEVFVAADPASSIFQNPKIKHIPCPPNGDYSQAVPDYIDVVHFHEIPSVLPRTPYIYTHHGNQTKKEHPPENTLYLSKSHSTNHGAKFFVYNGIPNDQYIFSANKQDKMLFMAMVNWRVKNALLALRLARESKMHLNLGGGHLHKAWKIWGCSLMQHYLLGQRWVTEFGSVGGEIKKRLLSESSLLFYIVKWSEPCAVAPQEAFASGTPVIAAPNGVLSEYIEHGINGYLVHNKQEALEAIKKHRALSSEKRAEMAHNCLKSLHSVRKMTEGYLHYYDHVIRNKRIYSVEEQPSFYFRKPQITLITG